MRAEEPNIAPAAVLTLIEIKKVDAALKAHEASISALRSQRVRLLKQFEAQSGIEITGSVQ